MKPSSFNLRGRTYWINKRITLHCMVLFVLTSSAVATGGTAAPNPSVVAEATGTATSHPATTGPAATRPSTPTSSPSTPQDVERETMELLRLGGQQSAEEFLDLHIRRYPNNRRLLFLRGCCYRSRFDISEAYRYFGKVAQKWPRSPEGQCSTHVIYLDARRDVEEHFRALRALADNNPDNLLMRWMIAVQCRAYNRNEEGVSHYQILLKKWSPGPALLHQTYANLLDELHRYKEALVERRKTVELAQEPWAYMGLGNTLVQLNLIKEAIDAYSKAVEIAPDDASAWESWGWALNRMRDFTSAQEKLNKALLLDPYSWRTWCDLGVSLEGQGKHNEALAKFIHALRLNPNDEYTKQRIFMITYQLNLRHIVTNDGP